MACPAGGMNYNKDGDKGRLLMVKDVKAFRENRVGALPDEFVLKKKIVAFPNDIKYKGLVIVDNIEFSTNCEHHAVAIEGLMHVGYIPNKLLIGLSQVARIIESRANVTTMTIQERLNQEVADELNKILKPEGLIVIIIARHNCMTARGVRQRNSQTTTSCIRGKFDGDLRMEFFQLLNLRRK